MSRWAARLPVSAWRRWAPLTALLVVCALAPPSVHAGEPKGAAPLFENVSEAAGLAGEPGARVVLYDLDGDGAPDAIIERTRLFRSRPATGKRAAGPRFERVRADAPFQAEGFRRPTIVQVGDVNGDGRADLYFGRTSDLSNKRFKDDGQRSEIWLAGADGTFRRVERSGVGQHAETIGSALFCDYDRDGVLDLFTGTAYTAYGQSLEAFPDRLYRGKGDGTFEDVTERAGLAGIAEAGRPESRKPSYGVSHGDWNNDGWTDLWVETYGRQWNRLWKSGGDGTFTDVAAETTFDGDKDRTGTYPPIVKRRQEPPFRSNGNTFDCAIADFDGDGDLDCFLSEITHWWAGSSSDRSMLLENLGAKKGFRFERRPDLLPARPHAGPRWNQGDQHAGWLDVDNDGRLDLVIASSDYPDLQTLRLYHQTTKKKFEDWTDRLGFSWRNASQISFGDYDRDGATDILVGTSNSRLSKEQREGRSLSVGLFRNRAAAAAQNRFLSLRLTGKGAGHANRDAVGARVTIWIGKKRQMREVYGGEGSAGHRNDPEVRFGVGKARRVTRLEVRWPDAKGTVQTFRNVATSRLYRLTEGGTLEPAR